MVGCERLSAPRRASSGVTAAEGYRGWPYPGQPKSGRASRPDRDRRGAREPPSLKTARLSRRRPPPHPLVVTRRTRDYAGGLVDRKLEPDRRLSAEAARNWDEISSGQMRFDRRREEAEVLKGLREGDLVRFFDR